MSSSLTGGTNKNFIVTKVKKCEDCNGTGRFDRGVDGYRDCRRCDGRGLRPLNISENRDIKLNQLLKEEEKISIFVKVKKLFKS